MGGESEAVGEVLTGSIVAGTIEGETNTPDLHEGAPARAACLNCGATLTHAFCAVCGQRARIHRSLLSLGHDILHSVFHLEGKIWRTIPELFLRPGRLTRRYIDGERAKFVSPMALFLFIVFVMFAAFSFTGGMFTSPDLSRIPADWQAGNAAAMEATREEMETVRTQLAAPDITEERRAELERELADLQSAVDVMEALAAGDFGRITQVKEEEQARKSEQQAEAQADRVKSATERRLETAVDQFKRNPGLMAYKLKTNAYKFSWALVPLSIPFLWLLFFWRRDIHLYDHAIFATYSISFMMLLLVLISLAATAGVSSAIWGSVLVFVPPIHLYKQLRGAYGLSRSGAAVRLFFLLIATSIVLSLFLTLLLFLGVFS